MLIICLIVISIRDNHILLRHLIAKRPNHRDMQVHMNVWSRKLNDAQEEISQILLCCVHVCLNVHTYVHTFTYTLLVFVVRPRLVCCIFSHSSFTFLIENLNQRRYFIY